ncbi:exopolysaccharide Pel transporter PelG [Methylobacterium durans]|uniref:exopolysaccharide Pel transporter PelG n=1 Tax=Methylobacterium durans TaxID=2202825 RepID=UPI002AFE8D93|nr:exopolysaccharide Pel transporter PelG [Methylobacterium durans]MEA1832374.1 exopolysaccharide Pel transporter PelG [Methylobacterium durans]
MAGIGFELRRLSSRDEILGPVAAVAHAAIVAAGPWLYTVMAILVIGEAASPLIGEDAMATFRVLVVYVFSLSLVGTSPVAMVGTRVLADSLYRRQYDDVRSVFVLTLLAASAATAILSCLVFVLLLRVPADVAVAGIAGVQIVSMVWVGLAFCGAVRDYLQVTLAFVTGLLAGVGLAVTAALHGYGPVPMVWGLAAGFMIVFLWLTARFASTFPSPCRSLAAAQAAFTARLRCSPSLAIGATAGAVSVWIDKWIIWTSGYGERVEAGLIHAPLYDGPMFIASLTVVPALALFVTSLETTFFDRYRAYFQAIDTHATLKNIRAQGRILERETTRTLANIMVVQTALCVIVVLTAPAIVEAVGLQFRQIGILRMGTVGALFQYLFMSCSALLIFFDATRVYATLQLIFLGSLAALTVLVSQFEPGSLGTGYMLACIVSGFASLFALLKVLGSIDYRVFVGSATQARPV